jgi:hypothetical protein
MKRVAILGAVVALAVGCGNGTPLVPNQSTATFSGAITGTANVIAFAGTNSGNASVAFGIDNTTGTYPTVTFAAEISGATLQTGTFTNTSASVVESTTVVQQTSSAGPTWEQSSLSGVSTGTMSLTITSVGPSTTSGANTAWTNPTGTFTASLPAVPGGAATGTVNVSVSF